MKFSIVAVWISLAVPPLAWFASFEANFAVAPLVCRGYGKAALYAISAVALAAAAAATGLAWHERSLIQSSPLDQRPIRLSRQQAMAIAGIGLGALFTLAILAQAIPNVLMAGCE